MTEIRRLRTQAERDADGTAWRAVAGTRPGYATYPGTAPGSPSWWLREANPALGIPVDPKVLAHALDAPAPVDGETCTKWCGFCHLGTGPAVVDETHHHTAIELPPPTPTLEELLTMSGMSGTRYGEYLLGAFTHEEHVEQIRAALVESAAAGKPVLLPDGSASVSYQPARRRWWHRLAGRWLHVFTPGFIGELVNDIWSHMRHRYTRRNP